ncbi:hypothetical protein [Streptomyces flaveus]|uniref:hypothetical protein n=1 Tax=Streptomyces flaveus TaxID=66370 RepID=UPI003325FD32
MEPHIRHCRTALASALLTPVPALAAAAGTARIPTGAPIPSAPCHSFHPPITVTGADKSVLTCAFASARQYESARTTAADRVRLLDVLTNTGAFLRTRAYVLKRLNEEPDGSAPYGPLPGWDEPELDATL